MGVQPVLSYPLCDGAGLEPTLSRQAGCFAEVWFHYGTVQEKVEGVISDQSDDPCGPTRERRSIPGQRHPSMMMTGSDLRNGVCSYKEVSRSYDIPA